jgi:hypothetical protein
MIYKLPGTELCTRPLLIFIVLLNDLQAFRHSVSNLECHNVNLQQYVVASRTLFYVVQNVAR